MPRPTRYCWTLEQDERLTVLFDSGAPKAAILAEFPDRTERAIYRHAVVLGLVHGLCPRRMWSFLRIVEAIEKNGPMTQKQLQAATGLSADTVYVRTRMAGDRGWLIAKKPYRAGRGDNPSIWEIGKLPEIRLPAVIKAPKGKPQPKVQFVARRDPMVAALFGSV